MINLQSVRHKVLCASRPRGAEYLFLKSIPVIIFVTLHDSDAKVERVT